MRGRITFVLGCKITKSQKFQYDHVLHKFLGYPFLAFLGSYHHRALCSPQGAGQKYASSAAGNISIKYWPQHSAHGWQIENFWQPVVRFVEKQKLRILPTTNTFLGWLESIHGVPHMAGSLMSWYLPGTFSADAGSQEAFAGRDAPTRVWKKTVFPTAHDVNLWIVNLWSSYSWSKQGFFLVTQNPQNWWGIQGYPSTHKERDFSGDCTGKIHLSFPGFGETNGASHRNGRPMDAGIVWVMQLVGWHLGWGLWEDPLGFCGDFAGRELWHSSTPNWFEGQLWYFFWEKLKTKDMRMDMSVPVIDYFQLNMQVWLHIHPYPWSCMVSSYISRN